MTDVPSLPVGKTQRTLLQTLLGEWKAVFVTSPKPKTPRSLHMTSLAFVALRGCEVDTGVSYTALAGLELFLPLQSLEC